MNLRTTNYACNLVHQFYDNIVQDHKFYMLDGDKIATLFAEFLNSLMQEAELNLSLGVNHALFY